MILALPRWRRTAVGVRVWAGAAADALTNSTFVEFPGLGDGAVFSAPCPEAVDKSFLVDPSAPDTSCVAGMGPPAWVVPAS